MEYLSLPPGRLTTSQAATACGVQPGTIRDWVRRGILTRSGGSPRHPIFRVEDVMAAKNAPKPSRPGQRGVNAA
ncbi:MerR family transcriptional regulator [Streptomyces neyagawaensis]|uniref:MerR family transcriptional regulator n=1 Tax=Streptomyces neyagawaensis TaxID=42238 RepID=UPI0007C76855|nr:helix-turn-helix domain-containing protein [Streptomyces neyagawaensis]MCL6733307.1 helix-turn-helix domain-containing protein [Streptomyces neyagawaensis]MDE1685109.1 helix-turn-helix domain-containing protein [Streptomyces neyagawaensis]